MDFVEGGNEKSIAQKPEIGARTVELHWARVMSRLHGGSLTELFRIALAAGVFTIGPGRVGIAAVGGGRGAAGYDSASGFSGAQPCHRPDTVNIDPARDRSAWA